MRTDDILPTVCIISYKRRFEDCDVKHEAGITGIESLVMVLRKMEILRLKWS